MQQKSLFEDELIDEGIPNPFYDPELASAERRAAAEIERKFEEKERQRMDEIEAAGLEYQICCAHVSTVDGSAYAVKILDGYEPKYVVYPDGLPDGVEAKPCDCGGKSDGWRGGELVNRFYERDKQEQNTGG